MIGMPIGFGKRLLSTAGGAARQTFRGARAWGGMASAGSRTAVFGAGRMLGGAMGRPGLMSAAGMGALNMAQYGIRGDNRGRGRSFGGFMGAGFRGAMGGGMMGGMYGAGRFFHGMGR